MKLDVWHNLLWSKYKAGVFSSLQVLSHERGIDLNVFQIAETASDRVALSSVDRSVHRYHYTLLFEGSLEAVPFWRRAFVLGSRTLMSNADCTILAGYERLEYWLQLLILRLRRKKPMVFCDSTTFDQPQTFFKSLLKRLFFTSCTHVFCYGQRSKDYVMSFGVSEKHISFRCQAASLPDNYDASQISSRRLVARKAISEAHRFLYIGRLSKEKRIDVLLKSMRLFLENSPEAQLIIVGSGPQEMQLKTLAASLGISNRVIFTGARSGKELFDEYLAASAFVLPSYSEPWGLVVNEALHYGCPVIVSDRCGCVPELVHDGITGYQFPCDSPEELFKAMEKSVVAFSDIIATADSCLKCIDPFSPVNAAREILSGVSNVMLTDKSHSSSND